MKKTAEVSALAAIIIVLASAILIGGVVYKLAIEGKALSDIEKCRLSILAAATTKSAPSVGEKVPVPKTGTHYIPIRCTRGKLGDVVLKKEDIVENSVINQDKAHKIIADAMAECWWMVGEGKLDPFSNWQDKGKSYCLMCKKITFDDELREYYDKSLTDPTTVSQRGMAGTITSPIPYLKDHDYKEGLSYWSYLYKTAPAFSQEELNKMGDSFVSEGSNIIIVMHKFNQKWWGWYVLGTLGAGILIIGGALLTKTGVGAIIGVPMLMAGLKILAIGTVAAAITVATFVPLTMNAFKDCPECNAVGGVALVPEKMDLNQQIPIEYNGVQYTNTTICDLLVN